MSPTLIIVTIALYILLLFVVAHLSARNATNGDFFIGSRRSPWLAVVTAMISAAMSGVTFISVPGSVAVNNFSYMQMVLGFIVGYCIIAFVLIPLFYRQNVVSLYEYLNHRYGLRSHSIGAWYFFVSKMLGASLRAFVICAVLQPMLFDRLGVPFTVNALLFMVLVWLYTLRGGVRSLIWTDVLKSLCLVGCVVLSIYLLLDELSMTTLDAVAAIETHPYSKIFFVEDINDTRHFAKQFIAGIFMVVAMTGLDQDIMQHVLSSRTMKQSQRTMICSVFLQSVVILLLLALGVLLYIYSEREGISVERADQLFGAVATSSSFPVVLGVIFVLGLISTTYSSAGSALTALTTSFTVDILRGQSNYKQEQLGVVRVCVHSMMAMIMLALILLFESWSNESVINIVYRVASYTYGPLLGMFAFGVLTKRRVRDRYVGIVAIASPIICFVLNRYSQQLLGGYKFGFELLVLNAALTMVGLFVLSINYKPKTQ